MKPRLAKGETTRVGMRVAGPQRSLTYRIVGQAVFPSVSDPQPLADGALFTARGLSRLGNVNGGRDLVVRLAPGITLGEAITRLRPITGTAGKPLTPTLVELSNRKSHIVQLVDA